MSSMVLICRERASTIHSSRPNRNSTVTVIHRLRSDVSMMFCSVKPRMMIGIEPMMTFHPSVAYLSPRPMRARQSGPFLPNRHPNQCDRMLMMSRRKYRITASSVPIWMMAVNAAPGSAPSIRSPMMRICALDDTGRYSGSACTIPRIIAWKKFMIPLE